MKIRTGFVSNSSTSSFVCDVCGAKEGGYDLGLSDVGWSECVNGHIVCDDHGESKEEEDYEGDLDNDAEDQEEDYDDYYVAEKDCLICRGAEATKDMMLTFLLHDLGKTRADFTKELRKQYPTWAEREKAMDERREAVALGR